MKLSKEEFGKIIPMSNYVLVKPQVVTHFETKLSSGLFLIEPEGGNSPMCLVGVWGTLVKNPLGLFYSKKDPDISMPWSTEIETRKGDEVLYNYTAAYTALGRLADSANPEQNPTWFMCEGEIYMFIRYSDLILAKRCEELTMLNGFILCEPMEEEKLSEIRKTLVLPEYLKKRMSLKYTKVVKIGSRNQEYLNDDYCRDGNEVREGDVVLYEKNYNIECEFDTHQKLGNRYFRIQRKNFAAIVKGGKQKAETISDIQPL